MKKVIRLTESDLTRIVRRVINENIKSIRNLIGDIFDDLAKVYEKNSVQTLEHVLSHAYSNPNLMKNIAGKGECLMSASGSAIPVSQFKTVLELVSQGKMTIKDGAKYFPDKFADGTKVRDIFSNMKPLAKKASSHLGSFQTKHLLNNCFNKNFCDVNTILSNFNSKISKIAKLPRFDPRGVKVLEHSEVYGREIIDVMLPDGQKILFYKSTGSNVATTGKKAGEWYVIPGFAEDGWFFKTDGTISFTKGSNKYLTEFAQYLEKNGVGNLHGTGNVGGKISKDLNSGIFASGSVISSSKLTNNMVDWTKITNAKNINDYNKLIANAMKTNNYSLISRGGFEKYGIDNFREFLKTKADAGSSIHIDPSKGFWSFKIK